jgi:hypothetical protein
MPYVSIERWKIIALALAAFFMGLAIGPVFMMFIDDNRYMTAGNGVTFSQRFGTLGVSATMGTVTFEQNGEVFNYTLASSEHVTNVLKAANTNVYFAFAYDYTSVNYGNSIKRFIVPNTTGELSNVVMDEVLDTITVDDAIGGTIVELKNVSANGDQFSVKVRSDVVATNGLSSRSIEQWYRYDVEADTFTAE